MTDNNHRHLTFLLSVVYFSAFGFYVKGLVAGILLGLAVMATLICVENDIRSSYAELYKMISKIESAQKSPSKN